MPFTGEYRHTIDTKGRLIVPSRLRDQLADDSLVLTVWPDPCISVWSGEGWQRLDESLQAQQQNDPSKRSAVRQFYAKGRFETVDKQGRITIPAHLLEHAGITREVLIVGAGNRAELWAPQNYEAEEGSVIETGFSSMFQTLDI